MPSSKEVDTEVQVQAEPLLTFPAAMGAVRIRGGFELRMDSPASSVALASTVVVHVYDCGEVIGDGRQRCKIVSGAAVHERAATVPQEYTPHVMLDGYQANSALYSVHGSRGHGGSKLCD